MSVNIHTTYITYMFDESMLDNFFRQCVQLLARQSHKGTSTARIAKDTESIKESRQQT